MATVTIELPSELLKLLGSEAQAQYKAKLALVLDLVRRRMISRARAAELLGMPLTDLPTLLRQYEIPWFDYSPEDLQHDLQTLRAQDRTS